MENPAHSILVIAESTARYRSIGEALGQNHQYSIVSVDYQDFDTLKTGAAISDEQPDLILVMAEAPSLLIKNWAVRVSDTRKLPIIFLCRAYAPEAKTLAKNSRVRFFMDDGSANLQTISLMLGIKIRLALNLSGAGGQRKESVATPVPVPENGQWKFGRKKLIAIGASMGGVEAVSRVLEVLPAQMPGIVMVQHMPQGFTEMYAKRLDTECRLRVVQAENNQYVEEGTVYLAPGGLHMKISREKESGYRIHVMDGDRVSGHKPSVNVLFSSVATAAGKDALGVILTGMGDDGARGLLEMRQAGAETIGQDEETALVYGMPHVAYEIGAVHHQAALMDVPKYLIEYANRK